MIQMLQGHRIVDSIYCALYSYIFCCSFFSMLMLQLVTTSGGFRGGALGASAPPAESMVKIS